MASRLRKGLSEIKIFIDSDMLSVVEKGIRVGIYHAIYRYAKANNIYIKRYDKNHHIIRIAMSSIWGCK